MANNIIFYRNTGYWFLLLLPLVLIGFYPTYFASFLQPAPTIIHIHFTLMAAWIIILVVQPFLFRYKKLALHRKIGKFTYVLVPLLLLSAFFMMRFSYYRFIEQFNLQNPAADPQQVLQLAAAYQTIAFLYFGWLAILYSLAIRNRRRSPIHARYMVATALTMLGPTVDRIVYASFKTPKLGGVIPIEMISFFLIDLTLAILLWKDYSHKRSTKALRTSLLIFLVGQILYFLVQKTDAWQYFVTFVMKPAP